MNCPALAHFLLGLALVSASGLVSCADLATSTGTPGIDTVQTATDSVSGATDAQTNATDAAVDTAKGTDATVQEVGPDVKLPPAPADLSPQAGECEGKWFIVTGVSDGDTFYIKDEDKGVRLAGIDTPEVIHNDGSGTANCGGEAAKAQLGAWLAYGVQVCLIQDPAQNYDSFGRKVRYVYVNLFGKPTLLNTKLLQLGQARIFTEYASKLKLNAAFKEHEAYAKTNAVGGWSSCAGDCWWTGKKPCP